MAVLALGFIGEWVGAEIGGTVLGIAASSIGGFIGSAIGGMIDNMLFPVQQQGPRLSDLSVQTSTYGNPIARLWGPENRIAGNVIFSTGLKETKHKQSSGGPFGKGGPSVDTTTYTYSTTFAVAICDRSKQGPIKGIQKMWANKKLIYDASISSGPLSGGGDDDPHFPGFIGEIVNDIFHGGENNSAELWTSFNVYPGSFTQNPDPVMEGIQGIGNTPAFRGTAYLVLENFQLADYGNRLPSIEVLCVGDDEITCAAVLSDIVRFCGIDPISVSTSSIDGNVRGFMIGSASSGTAAIQPLALAYNFDAAQVGGSLRFQGRGRSAAGTITNDELAGHAHGDDRPAPMQWTRNLETSLPREASITFLDPDRDWQENSQTARRQSGSADSNLTSSVALVMDVDTARQLCDRMLWEAWVGRVAANSQSDDRLIGVDAGRVYNFETPAGYEPLRVKSKTRGANAVIELELARDRSAVYNSTAAGIAAPTPPEQVNVPGPSYLALLDTPILQDADDDTGFYFVIDGDSTDFRGCDVVRSTDGGETYDEIEPVGFESVIGTVDHFGPGPTDVFDNLNVLRVTLFDPEDELESVTELDVLNGKNAAWIGEPGGHDGEIVQFKTATLIAPGVYDLSGWLRGRLGTEYAVGSHASGENFVLLEAGALKRADFSPGDWNKDRTYKAVSLLTQNADADPVDFINTGEGKRPISPVHITSTTADDDDMTITWVRRSRLRQPGLGNGPLPLGESVEAYEIDIIVGSVPVRTLTSSVPSVVYDAAAQATDGLSSGDTIQVAVYQMSDVRGRGRPGYAELTK